MDWLEEAITSLLNETVEPDSFFTEAILEELLDWSE